MILLKTQRDLEAMRPACRVARVVLDEVTAYVSPGMTTQDIDNYAAARMKLHGSRSAFLGYRKYPCHCCISVNDEVVHGACSKRLKRSGQ